METMTNHPADQLPTLLAWFAAAGISADLVDRCPATDCEICVPTLASAA